MMKNISLALFSIFFCIVFSIVSCGDNEPEDPIIPNEEELITTLNYTLISDDGSDVVVFSFEDLDGDGGVAPTLTSDTLMPNMNYNGKLNLYNNGGNVSVDIGAEVNEEGEDHQFFFQTTLPELSIQYVDQDANGNPIGINTELTTGDAGSGTLTITLRHEPDKNATGVSGGDIMNAGGETDIEVTFDVEVR